MRRGAHGGDGPVPGAAAPQGSRCRRGSLTSCQTPSSRAASAGRAMGLRRRRRTAPGAAGTARAPPRGHPSPGPPRARPPGSSGARGGRASAHPLRGAESDPAPAGALGGDPRLNPAGAGPPALATPLGDVRRRARAAGAAPVRGREGRSASAPRGLLASPQQPGGKASPHRTRVDPTKAALLGALPLPLLRRGRCTWGTPSYHRVNPSPAGSLLLLGGVVW